jgi:hypothetical protein
MSVQKLVREELLLCDKMKELVEMYFATMEKINEDTQAILFEFRSSDHEIMTELIETTTKNQATMAEIKFKEKLFEMIGAFDKTEIEMMHRGNFKTDAFKNM